jgi:isoleucyl-tRNA synthetase
VAIRPITDFIDDLSVWYLRRSRERFKDNNLDKADALGVLRYVLQQTALILAPIMPFLAEIIYQEVKEKNALESVHLCEWPKVNKKLIKKDLEVEMAQARKIASSALAERVLKGIKVKQPLRELRIGPEIRITNLSNTMMIIEDEVNVKNIIQDNTLSGLVELDTNITEELKEEGYLRELIREVQSLRKEQNLVPQDRILVEIVAPDSETKIIEKNKENLLKEFRANEILIRAQEVGRSIKINRV